MKIGRINMTGAAEATKVRHARYAALSAPELFYSGPIQSKIDKTADCWIWIGAKQSLGYGTCEQVNRRIYVHRLSWFAHFGKIPTGLVIDHLCCNKACCNPCHMETVTHEENSRRGSVRSGLRKQECLRGHSLIGVSRTTQGKRRCRACDRIRRRSHPAKAAQ